MIAKEALGSQVTPTELLAKVPAMNLKLRRAPMLARWTEFLPLILVKMLARRCEKHPGFLRDWHIVRPDVLIRKGDTVRTANGSTVAFTGDPAEKIRSRMPIDCGEGD